MKQARGPRPVLEESGDWGGVMERRVGTLCPVPRRRHRGYWDAEAGGHGVTEQTARLLHDGWSDPS